MLSSSEISEKSKSKSSKLSVSKVKSRSLLEDEEILLLIVKFK